MSRTKDTPAHGKGKQPRFVDYRDQARASEYAGRQREPLEPPKPPLSKAFIKHRRPFVDCVALDVYMSAEGRVFRWFERAHLLAYANNGREWDGWFAFPLSQIASFGFSRRTVVDAIRAFEALGMIDVRRGAWNYEAKRHDHTLYRLVHATEQTPDIWALSLNVRFDNRKGYAEALERAKELAANGRGTHLRRRLWSRRTASDKRTDRTPSASEKPRGAGVLWDTGRRVSHTVPSDRHRRWVVGSGGAVENRDGASPQLDHEDDADLWDADTGF
jgi:hypothetical protein